ncbi:MAG: L,D-transpeptidase [Pseudomonadota bacterium]
MPMTGLKAFICLVFLGLAAPLKAGELVEFEGYNPGTIVIHTKARKLYYVTSADMALQYKIGVGRSGKQWSGTTFVMDKRVWPAWSPPASVKRAEPWLPDVIPGGENNPMGARAILLEGEYAIHGTNKPETVGGFVSYGCFRMYNWDVEELYQYVQPGTPVVVTH